MSDVSALEARDVAYARALAGMVERRQRYAVVPDRLRCTDLVGDPLYERCGSVERADGVMWVCLLHSAHDGLLEGEHGWPAPEERARVAAAVATQYDPELRVLRSIDLELAAAAQRFATAGMPPA